MIRTLLLNNHHINYTLAIWMMLGNIIRVFSVTIELCEDIDTLIDRVGPFTLVIEGSATYHSTKNTCLRADLCRFI